MPTCTFFLTGVTTLGTICLLNGYVLLMVSGLVYVVDSTDTERLVEAKEELEGLLDLGDMRGVPVLVIANKQDMQSWDNAIISLLLL